MAHKIGEVKSYDDIETYATENDYTLKELGPEYIGENFIVLTHNSKDQVESFVLVGATTNGYLYRCVYFD